jgi:hypothetical protein
MTGSTPMRRPLSARKLDVLYLVFFVIHVPIMFCKYFFYRV